MKKQRAMEAVSGTEEENKKNWDYWRQEGRRKENQKKNQGKWMDVVACGQGVNKSTTGWNESLIDDCSHIDLRWARRHNPVLYSPFIFFM